jgi:cytoskeletal protein CcmA (bactofilin family)
MKESHISSDLTIEGKISGSGHIRIAGRFKGDVAVDGNVSLDAGARLEGHVKASVVSVGGELIGNIENAKRVELLETGVINGDVKAGSLTVAAGSRMRGQVEFGYEGEGRKGETKGETKGFGNA